ncbi:MAG: hypothetical protein K0R94_1512 [Burkholderiales bacterium]|jgi:hypothetical protein|nr:hypothetical protein [Burkholderiales bacterium]
MVVDLLISGLLGVKLAIAKGYSVVKPFFMVAVLVNVLISFYELLG